MTAVCDLVLIRGEQVDRLILVLGADCFQSFADGLGVGSDGHANDKLL